MNEPTQPQAQPNDGQPRFSMKAQYIKDLSFENPHAPASMLALREAPRVDVSADLAAQKLQDNVFELTLRISVRAATERTLFIVDLSHAGLFEIQNIPEQQIEQLLLVDCAFILFPYTRRIVSDVTRDGGFPPLMMEPFDFYSLFMENRNNPAATGTR